MAQWTADTVRMETAAQRITRCASALRTVGQDVRGLCSAYVPAELSTALRALSAGMDDCARRAADLSGVLAESARIYRDAEQRLSGVRADSGETMSANSGGSFAADVPREDGQDKPDREDFDEFAKTLALAASGDSEGFLQLITGAAEGEWSDMAEGLVKMSTDGAATDWITAAIDSADDNWEEFGELSWRFWQEFAVETILGAAVGLGLGALAAATLPAWAAPLAAAGAGWLLDWGLDSLVEWSTGGAYTDWADFVGDGIIEFAGDAWDAAGDLVSDIGDAVSAGYGALCDWLF